MEFRILGMPADSPSLRLDHREFAYAGKYVMTNTGKAVIEDETEILGAVAFNRDRTEERTWWCRYITVRADRRGEGIGTNLLESIADHLLDRPDSTGVKIAVNNPFAYHASYKAGFGYTGEQTGIAELVMRRPDQKDPQLYAQGLEEFLRRDDLSAKERLFVEDRLESPRERPG